VTEKIKDMVQSQNFLPEVSPVEQVRWMLERPDAEAFIEAQDPVVLLRVMEQAGWEEASAMIPYVSPWQLQVFLDFDLWRKDRFDSGKLLRWFDAALELADDQKFKRFCRETDAEMLALLFKDNLIVGIYDEDGEPPPEFNDYEWSASPDGVYLIVFPEDEDMGTLLRRMVNRLYEVDRVMAWTLLEAARWELHSNMEEEAYRWRNSRLEEFGFVSREEALEIYRPIDPVKFRDTRLKEVAPKNMQRIGKTTLPALFDPGQVGAFYILKIMDGLEEDVLGPLFNELIAVQNRALLADGVEPSNASIAREITERTLGFMSLGLEFLARGDDDAAEVWITNVPLREVFRVGFSLVGKLRRTALDLAQRPALTIVDGEAYSLLAANEQTFMEGLCATRPVMVQEGEFVNFERQSQVDEAANLLAYVAFKQLWTFGVQKLSPASLMTMAERYQNPAIDLNFDVFFATGLGNFLLKTAPQTGFNKDRLQALTRLVQASEWKSDPVGYFEAFLGPVFEALGPGAVKPSSKWLNDTLGRMQEELGRLNEFKPELHTNLLLIAR